MNTRKLNATTYRLMLLEPLAIQVRLRPLSASKEGKGRVEVLYNEVWGTICDDYWGLDEAHVICRMLNYSGAQFAPRNAFFGRGSIFMPIHLDNIKCRGDESTIAACRHNGWGQNDCLHSEDASVVCWTDSAPPIQGMEPLVIQRSRDEQFLFIVCSSFKR